MSFLNLEDKTFLVVGIANRKSVAYFAARTLLENGARVVASVKSDDMVESVRKLVPEADIVTCDVEQEEDVLFYMRVVT